MTKTLQTPEFQNEAEEATWWDSHPEEILGVLEQAAIDGTFGRGTLGHCSQTASTSIQLEQRVNDGALFHVEEPGEDNGE